MGTHVRIKDFKIIKKNKIKLKKIKSVQTAVQSKKCLQEEEDLQIQELVPPPSPHKILLFIAGCKV